MVNIFRSADYGGSTKNQFAENLMVAFTLGDTAVIEPLLCDDVVWDFVGGECLKGKQAILKHFKRKKKKTAGIEKLIVMFISSHGKSASVEGHFYNAKDKKTRLCYFFKFTDIKFSRLDRVITYTVKL